MSYVIAWLCPMPWHMLFFSRFLFYFFYLFIIAADAWELALTCNRSFPVWKDGNLVWWLGLRVSMGPFKCYVTQMRWGWGVKFFGKKHYEGERFNVISVTRGWMGVQFLGKKHYVTLEWGAYLCFPVPMFPGTDVPRTYVPRCLCSPVPMFPGTDVPRFLYFNSGH